MNMRVFPFHVNVDGDNANAIVVGDDDLTAERAAERARESASENGLEASKVQPGHDHGDATSDLREFAEIVGLTEVADIVLSDTNPENGWLLTDEQVEEAADLLWAIPIQA